MEQNAIIAWTLAALVVLLVGACTPVQALLGIGIGYTATLGGPVVHRWYESQRRIWSRRRIWSGRRIWSRRRA